MLFKQLLETSLGPEFETLTDSHQEIMALNKTPCWKLKGIVAQITLKLYQKYMVDYAANRSGNKSKNRVNKKSLNDFHLEFDQNYAEPLCQSHLKVLCDRKKKFVGMKTLNCALKFTSIALSKAKTRKICQPHIQTILYELTLPLLLITEYEFTLWSENPIEYVRLQVDNSNAWNVKRTNQDMIKAICNIKKTRKMKISDYLTNYLSNLVDCLGQQYEDFRYKESFMHAFGLLSLHMAHSEEYQSNAIKILEQFFYQELSSEQGFLRARACWVYGQFASFPFENADHLRYALNALYENLSHDDLPVRVNAAVSLIKLLNHEVAIEFIRPGLSDIIKIYLKLIDDIDYDELIEALRKIVDVFEADIGPYALQLCTKLGEAFLRLHENRRQFEGSNSLEQDSETSLTAEGLMTAIRRILQSISGKFPEMYP